VSISCYFQNAQVGNHGEPWGPLGNLFRKQEAQKWRDRTAYLACFLGVVLKIKGLEMARQTQPSYVKESENIRRERLWPPRRVKFQPKNEPLEVSDFASIRSEREQATAALLTALRPSPNEDATGRGGPAPRGAIGGALVEFAFGWRTVALNRAVLDGLHEHARCFRAGIGAALAPTRVLNTSAASRRRISSSLS